MVNYARDVLTIVLMHGGADAKMSPAREAVRSFGGQLSAPNVHSYPNPKGAVVLVVLFPPFQLLVVFSHGSCLTANRKWSDHRMNKVRRCLDDLHLDSFLFDQDPRFRALADNPD